MNMDSHGGSRGLSHASLGGNDDGRWVCACRILLMPEICEFNAFQGQNRAAQKSACLSKPPVLPIVLSSPPPDRNTRNRTRLQSSARYASSQNNHMSMLLHFSPSTSACFKCQQRSVATASSCGIRNEHSVHPLRRCKMSSPSKHQRKSFAVTFANADILLDQPAPDHSTKAILSISSMGDATVNGDMPSSSFLSVSSLFSTSNGLRHAVA